VQGTTWGVVSSCFKHDTLIALSSRFPQSLTKDEQPRLSLAEVWTATYAPG